MYRIRNLIVILCTGFVWLACADQFEKDGQLQMAYNAIDTDPRGTLRMLEGMNLQWLDKHERMQYVVLTVHMDYQDITGDTLILEAQRYFAGSPHPEMAARASFYAASFCREKKEDDKALEYYLLANYYAKQADNRLFQAKSMHWIGSMYYNQDVLDSAILYYQNALELYKQEPNAETYRLDLIFLLGRTYRELGQFSQALDCFDSELENARKLHNIEYEARLLYNKGIVYRERKEFQQAKEYFDQALSKKPHTEDSLRVYLDYARLYKATNQPDSTFLLS